MRALSLEWSSPAQAIAGPLAGPWRGEQRADATTELFCVRVPIDAADVPRMPAPLPARGPAMTRLLAVLQGPPVVLPPAEAELLRAHADGEPTAPVDEVARTLLELARRAVGPARVETIVGDRVCVFTDIPASGSLVTQALATTPAALATLHVGAVAAALAARVALLRAALETTQLAAALATAAGPAAARRALPLAWRFLHGVLAEHASPDGA